MDKGEKSSEVNELANTNSKSKLQTRLTQNLYTTPKNVLLGVEDILISWFVIILALGLLAVASLVVCCMIHCKHLRLSDANKLSYLLTCLLTCCIPEILAIKSQSGQKYCQKIDVFALPILFYFWGISVPVWYAVDILCLVSTRDILSQQ